MASTQRAFIVPCMEASRFFVLIFALNVVAVAGESEVITEENWDIVLKGHWMIKFYAPWCPACRNLRPIWDKFAVEAESLNVRVAEVDVTKNTALSGRFGIVSLPTVYHAINGEFRLYKEKRKVDELVSFIELRKWENIEAIPSWKSPGSVLMGALGVVFKVSLLLKDIHTSLTETYGLPAWGSYVIFGIGTVIIGLILGMFLVFVSDHLISVIWPAPAHSVSTGVEQPNADDAASEETKEGDDADKDEEKEELAKQDSSESATVRKRAKKLKATME